MDQDAEMKRLKWVLFTGLVFLVSAYFSWTELKFFMRGKTAEATVTGTSEYRKYTSVDYRFSDDSGTLRTENDRVPASWPVPEIGTTLKVQYLDAQDSSRVAGHSNMVSVYVFLACCAVLGFLIFRLFREASKR